LTIGTDPSCDFSFQLEKESIAGMEFTVTEKNEGTHRYTTSLVGTHNIYNIVGAIAVARALGLTHAHCQRGLERFHGIPGRLQRVPNSVERHVFVDYAHTPDALEKVLQSLRRLMPPGKHKLITVFGCGGDRDQGKRPLMGGTAQKFSDIAVVTSDNPRTEDPKTIVDGILSGMDKSKAVTEIDREKALRKAAKLSAPGDIILIAGKGHEDYQIIGRQTLAFSDFEKMKAVLQEMRP
jgi:UDP-N-acetylmuramyl-tripeptide synthetase